MTTTNWSKVCGGFGLFLLSLAGLGLSLGLVMSGKASGAEWTEFHIVTASMCAAVSGIGGLFGVLLGFIMMVDNYDQ